MIFQGKQQRGIGPTANKIIPKQFLGKLPSSSDSGVHVTYFANGATGGAVPVDGASYEAEDTATILGNSGSLVKTGYVFAGWKLFSDE